MTTELYRPEGSYTLDTIDKIPQIRLGLQSAPGEGKTYAALTFPNPIVANLNRGLGAHIGRSDVIDIPFYDPVFIDKLAKRMDSNSPPNRRDAVLTWMRKEAHKLTENQTLIMDGLSDLDRAFHLQEALEPVMNRQNEIDTRAAWAHKIDYFSEIVEILTSVRCNVVLICHEQLDRDAKGNLNGKLKPLIAGQTGDKLAKDFTDWFRQKANDKLPAGERPKPETLRLFGMSEPEFITWVNSFPRNTVYFWQTEADPLFSGKCSSLINFPRFIPADYKSFLKYRRTISPKVVA